MRWLEFAPLALALICFIISTRQSALWVRGVAWLAGAGFLALGAVQLLTKVVPDYLIWPTPSLLWTIAENPRTAAPGMLHALGGNWQAFGGALKPVFDVSWIMGALLGALSLFAFTPGERTERLVRILTTALLGGVFGAVLALTFVATGFAGYQKYRVYHGTDQQVFVHDGDTLRMGDVSLRLAGVDAPELSQRCVRDQKCGDAADTAREFIRGKTVLCEHSDERDDPLVPKESFGRPLVKCVVIDSAGKGADLALHLIQEGRAVFLPRGDLGEDSDLYQAAQENAKLAQKGLWGDCAITPDAWRNNRNGARTKFETGDYASIDSEFVVGECSKAPPTH